MNQHSHHVVRSCRLLILSHALDLVRSAWDVTHYEGEKVQPIPLATAGDGLKQDMDILLDPGCGLHVTFQLPHG